MDCQAILAETLRDDFHDSLGIALVAEPNHEVVRKADQVGIALKAWLHFLLEPKIKHLVQEHIRKHG